MQQVTTDDQILEVVRVHPGCTMDEVMHLIPELDWSDVFLAVDHLSRSGRLRLTRSGGGFLMHLHAL
jgi:hypothetical protein